MITTTNKTARAFYRFRYSAIGTVLLAYLIYDSYPSLNFGLVLLATAAGVIALTALVSWVKRSRRPSATSDPRND